MIKKANRIINIYIGGVRMSKITNKMKLSNFINQNKAKLYEQARKNVNLNENGQPTISKNDDWFHEDVWDEHYKRMSGN